VAVSLPQPELDSCGIGFVADAQARPSRGILDAALEALRRMRHRGAVAADRRTGDGAGVLMPIPPALVPGPWCGLATVFLRDAGARAAIEAACAAEGIGLAGWREVPVDPSALGEAARETLPRIEQLVLVRPLGAAGEEAERRAYRARKRAERTPGAYVVSLSFRTVTYKALCAADQLAAFYADLRDPAVAVSFAIFHQRFSTNTSPSWERAQPFRLLCHNGEINALRGNEAAMRAREPRLGDDLLRPVLEESGSDSAMLDNALELLVRGGRDVRHGVAMLVPPAWQHDSELDPDLRAFYRYHAGLIEPWDGPAGIVFTDGRVVGAALDRNGLRPLRYAITDDGLVACASEAGAVPLPEGARVRRGRLGPGQVLAVDPAGLGIEEDVAVKRRLARRRPYLRWLAVGRRVHDVGKPVLPPTADLRPRQVLAAYTREDLTLVLRPSASQGHEPVSSMGDDTALPPLAGRARPVFSYFRQRFAQVTNPAIDHLRERSVMSLRTLLGPREMLLAEEPEAARLVELESFFLFPFAVAALRPQVLDATFGGREGLAEAVARLALEACDAVHKRAPILVLSDEHVAEGRIPIPSLIALAGVHAALVEAGLRTRTSLVVESDEPRETHHFACLLGYGADAVCPRLALETVAGLAAADKLGGDRPGPEEAQARFRACIEDGVLKVMAKMGISDLDSYRGAEVFEALGLGRDVLDACFRHTPALAGGVGFAELEREACERLAASQAAVPELENPGYVKFRKGGEPHATSPDVVDALQRAAAHSLRRAVAGRGDGWDAYRRFAELVNGRGPLELRDLLEPAAAGKPVPVESVEPVESIVRRFSSGGMSHGSLSAEAHETVAIAFNRLGGRSNSGEGGEDPARFGTERNSAIKQVASGRFGVTAAYAVAADELQIKIAQGSKPGEGGQLPGHKVSEEIARLRHTQPGVALISPPPHHDIYSIEDLAQLIFDLKQVSPGADVSVKLVAEAGVGLVAAGVVKALADVVHVAGADGGTGASPLSSIKNAGAPWELGLAETQRTLVEQGLRGRVRLRVDGGLKTGRDVVVAALLGADEVSFGTAVLLAQGCLMVRSCHLDTCPVGIATQRPELRAKFAATPEHVEAYLTYVAGEVREQLAALGLRRFDDAVGRADLLRARKTGDSRADGLDLSPLLAGAGGRYAGDLPLEPPGGELGARLEADAGPALAEPRLVELAYPIGNADRTVGARLGGAIAARWGEGVAPPGRVRVRFDGSAGQSFGAFLTVGARLSLVGEANDYVGKAMSGGRIVIRPPADDQGDPVLVGNAVLYGATGGELFCAGRAGERFAVRNSGAAAVVEGTGDHVCEYMTGGTVVVLGEVGRNACAGMSGGQLYVFDAAGMLGQRLNEELVEASGLDASRTAELRTLVELHARTTGSPRAVALLERWDEAAVDFVRITPKAEVVALQGAAEGTAVAGA
jgi:glutamate synthase domain-containing protein 2/glutamate synthase domain-containing protein 1/glutamate synthase domain-containing protein 3